MPSRNSCFTKMVKRLRKGTIVPRQGHHRARVRALLCPRKAQWCTSQTPPLNPKPRFLSFRDTSRKQVICTSETTAQNVSFTYSLCFISKETLIFRRFFTINNLKTVGGFKLKLYFCGQENSIYMETVL